MREKIEEYESIRNEIIAMEEIQRNVWINMYVLFSALFVLGLQWSEKLFLVTYVILIPFQCVINEYRWAISRMSIYIRYFFENDEKFLNWESLYKSFYFQEYDRRRKKSLRYLIAMSGSIHQGLLSTGAFLFFYLKDLCMEARLILELKDILLIVLSIVLFIILVVLNKDYYKDYEIELGDVIKKYKKDIDKSIENTD